MDGGMCVENVPGSCPGDDDYVSDEETPPPILYYGHAPQVETRLSVPDTYGLGQDESGPPPPGDVQVGWLSPVNNSSGDIALPPAPPGAIQDDGSPGGANVAWNLHDLFCTYGPGCRFSGYVVPGCPPT
jgi:hypothetical protein